MELITDDLEYIIFVAREYCYPNKQQLKDCDAIRDAEDMAVSIAIPQFKQRHPILMKEFKEAYDTYLSNDKIQNTLTIYGLNPDKFWLLFLFITDFTNSCFIYSQQNEKYTIRETAKKMSQLINKEEVKNYSLTLSCVEETISSSNPLLIALFEDFCAKLSDNNDTFLDTTYYKTLEVVEDKVKTKKMKFFVELFRYFLYNRVEARQPSKMSFIGKFLYLAQIVEEEKEFYYNGYFATPITPKNKFLVKRYGTITIKDKEFIKEPVDIGKDIADTVKKCTDYTPISTSNYFCAPL
ncbi:hypothetical protein [Bacteroides thetaiotaomicron]|uniref:hypothetical protein n=1 Tax=Bacteroides thetaiotaomicron TaxID=818 RepID=UPI0018A14696|nr:hypothetical protein [Bacteroides thetaiotaomicron]MDC2232799.1 hypothetical protein [Bacteroides thetaiotaomicron]